MYYTNTGHNQLAKNIQALYRTGSNYDLGADALQKAEEWDLEKGRTPMPLGAHANWGGIEYLKTASGWKPVGKHRGHVKANHDIIHHNEDKDKDHAQMVHDAGNMNESEWTKKHGTNLHTKYKAVHDYLHKEKVKKEEKTRNGNPVKQRQHDLATEVVNKLKNGESSQRFITLPDGSKVVEHIQPNKGKDAGSYSRYHMASNRDKSTAVKINGYLTEDEIHHHLRHAFADNAAKIDEQERKDAERFANKKETKPEEKKESREDYLKTAKEDVKNGMDTSAFKEKYGKHEHFDSDDHLMLRNMTSSNPRKKEPVKEEPKLIELTGKETKKDLINLLITGESNFEGSKQDSEWLFRHDSKEDLLRKVKIYNANKSAGGNGNISSYHNDEAHSHKDEVDKMVHDYLAKRGITQENIKDHIPQKKGLELLAEWKEYLNKEHNGFVGHTKEEKDKAFNKLKEIFDAALPKDKPKEEGKHKSAEKKNQPTYEKHLTNIEKEKQNKLTDADIDKQRDEFVAQHGSEADKAALAKLKGNKKNKEVETLVNESLKHYNSVPPKQQEKLKKMLEDNNKMYEDRLKNINDKDYDKYGGVGAISLQGMKDKLEAGKEFLKRIA